MQNRELIVKELFELRLLLNRSNPKPNQKTEIEFCLHISKDPLFKSEFVIRLKEFPSTAITLSRKNKKLKWEIPSVSYAPYLEDFCIVMLNKEFELERLVKTLRNFGV